MSIENGLMTNIISDIQWTSLILSLAPAQSESYIQMNLIGETGKKNF